MKFGILFWGTSELHFGHPKCPRFSAEPPSEHVSDLFGSGQCRKSYFSMAVGALWLCQTASLRRSTWQMNFEKMAEIPSLRLQNLYTSDRKKLGFFGVEAQQSIINGIVQDLASLAHSDALVFGGEKWHSGFFELAVQLGMLPPERVRHSLDGACKEYKTACSPHCIAFRRLRPAKCQVVSRRFAGNGVLRCLCHLQTLQRSKHIFFDSWIMDRQHFSIIWNLGIRITSTGGAFLQSWMPQFLTVPVLEVERLQCLGFNSVILHESFSGFSLACLCFCFYSPNSFSFLRILTFSV